MTESHVIEANEAVNRVNSVLTGLKAKVQYVREKLLEWYKKNGRSYPWRTTDDPYKILIAEIMLRRTRADQVLPVYNNFVRCYPTVKALAEGEEESIEKLTYSLGLHWRNQELGDLARHIISKYQGEIPKSRDELMEIPGVGQYVAGVLLSSAYNKKEWIVDTNVIRVFSRFFGLRIKGDGRRNKEVIMIAKQFVDCENPRQANFAVIDFAALICRKINPLHSRCPISWECAYYDRHR